MLYLLITYNSLIRIRNRVRESFGAIDIYLQKRFDTLTQAAETVAAYATHERETLQNVTALRSGMRPDAPPEEKIRTYNQMDKMLRGIMLQVESYPQLKANENYLLLQRTITDLEAKLSASRRTYNANVTEYNTKIETIPTNIFAGAMGFRRMELLEIDEAKKADVNLRNILRG